MDAPVIGAHDLGSCASAKWEFGTTWRYQMSHRHFVGSAEQEERIDEGSEVINKIHLVDLSLKYRINHQWSITGSVPFMFASRSSALRDANREVYDRTKVYAGDMSDMSVVARRWLFDTRKPHAGNIQFGWGIKIPTGAYGLWDNKIRASGGVETEVYETVDQSIQPGDGGWGIVLDMQAVRGWKDGQVVMYGAWNYLINPRVTNGTPTFRGAANEKVMSVADQYVARVGASFAPLKWRGLSMSIGGRVEGVPPNDLIDSSDGFRRPGFGVAVEPGLSFTRGKNTFAVLTPILLYRERQQSIPDRDVEPERHGDAAFADWVWFAGYWRRF